MSTLPDLIYFTDSTCSVCHALLPELQALVNKKFPNIQLKVFNIREHPGLVSEYMVFAAPTLLIRSGRVEYGRFSGVFSLLKVENLLNRIVEFST